MAKTWNAFLDHTVTKLEVLFLQADFHPGNSSPLARFKNLIGKLTEIRQVKENELPAAKSIQYDYQRKAAEDAAEKKMTGLRMEAALILDSILEDWEVAKACAEALVRHMTAERSKREIILHVYFSFQGVKHTNELAGSIAADFIKAYDGTAGLERCTPTILLFGGGGSHKGIVEEPDGLMMIVRTQHFVFCNELYCFLHEHGAKEITMFEPLQEQFPAGLVRMPGESVESWHFRILERH